MNCQTLVLTVLHLRGRHHEGEGTDGNKARENGMDVRGMAPFILTAVSCTCGNN